MGKHEPSRTIEVSPADAAAVSAFKRSAEEYAGRLTDRQRHHLLTKPFYALEAEVDREHLGYFHDVAHLLSALDLPCGSHILDVACGPGWLSEAFYRFGYDVTGVDISADLLAVAARRLASLPFPPFAEPGHAPRARFLKLDVETEALPERFAGIVLYDCLHHFVDTAAVLANLRAMLAPGGRLVIVEGAMPPRGSAGERDLLAETAAHGTLEAPFAPEALSAALAQAGFATVESYLVLDGLFPRTRAAQREVERRFRSPSATNFFVCQAEATLILPLTAAPPWRATIEVETWRLVPRIEEKGEGAARRLDLVVWIGNGGRRGWVSDGTLAPGNVCLGVRLLDAGGAVLEENAGRTPLGRFVGPTETVRLELSYPLPADLDAVGISLDLVLQGRFWFADQGSPVLRREVPAPG
jgi:SAM-dependent methyltransferase